VKDERLDEVRGDLEDLVSDLPKGDVRTYLLQALDAVEAAADAAEEASDDE